MKETNQPKWEGTGHLVGSLNSTPTKLAAFGFTNREARESLRGKAEMVRLERADITRLAMEQAQLEWEEEDAARNFFKQLAEAASEAQEEGAQ